MKTKEWKGNKKSVSTMLGISTTWHPEERAAGDYYTTDPTAVRQFINYLQIDGKITEGIIWEPACGCGNISKELINAGYNVFSTDLHDRGFGESGIDFLQTFIKPLDCDTIITNPPYSLANEFILKAMDALPKHGRYYALMNISYLAGIKRHQEIYSKGYLRAIHIYPHRIHCYKNNNITGHSSPVNYAWFEFSPSTLINKYIEPRICWIQK